MKNENENENETNPKKWTDEKIINIIIDLSHEAEKDAKRLKNFMHEIAITKAGIYSSNSLIDDRDLGYEEQMTPSDWLIDLVLNVRELHENVEILRAKINKKKKNIEYFRAIINNQS